MAAISASDVKALRDSTGAGMMDCKRALSDAEGDVAKALDLLRERGQAKAGKRSGRETSEGTIAIALEGGQAGIIELGCETDFVAKTDDFQALAASVAAAVAKDVSIETVDAALVAPLEGGTVGETITTTIARVGENIALKRVGRVQVDGGVAGGYVHAGGKLGVIVGIEAGSNGADVEAAAKDLAMHVAAADPTPISIDRTDVPTEVVEKERDLLTREAKQSGKPDKVIDKIVEGRLNKFFAENCLLEQAFVKDPDRSVADLLKGLDGDVSVSGFARFKLGEAASA